MAKFTFVLEPNKYIFIVYVRVKYEIYHSSSNQKRKYMFRKIYVESVW